MNSLVQAQIAQMDLKLKHFETLEAMLDQERRDLQAERTKMYCERLAWRKVVEGGDGEVRAGSSLSGVTGVAEGEVAGKMVAGVEGMEGGGEILKIDGDVGRE